MVLLILHQKRTWIFMKDLLAFGCLTIKSHIRIVFVFMHITKWVTKLDLYLPGIERALQSFAGFNDENV